jgi:hypothetical protein
MKIIESIMGWMGSSNDDIVRETMSLITCILFNANRTAQVRNVINLRVDSVDSAVV